MCFIFSLYGYNESNRSEIHLYLIKTLTDIVKWNPIWLLKICRNLLSFSGPISGKVEMEFSIRFIWAEIFFDFWLSINHPRIPFGSFHTSIIY